MRILTFNHHESYLASLAQTGYQFDIVTKRGSLDLAWNTRSRPVPDNCQLIEFNDQTKQTLRAGGYDVVICHTVKNLIWLWLYFKPSYIFVAHIPLFSHSFSARIKSKLKKFIWHLFRKSHKASFFAVSHFKLQSWEEAGACAVLAPGNFPPLRRLHEPSKVLIICNHLAQRGEELGLEMIRRLAAIVPIKTVGNNPGIDFNITPRDFSDFQDIVTNFKIYLYTIKMPWGDGYNTAMLEAMKMGMAIVTVENPTSPIVHGINGLIGRSEEELIRHIDYLRHNPDEAQRLGAAAIETIKKDFSEERFITAWQAIITQVGGQLPSH